MHDDSCPICHGTGQVHYDWDSSLLPVPIPCTCCHGTGRRLWLDPGNEADQTRRLNAIEYGRLGGMQSRRRGPTRKTLIALSCSQYGVYVVACRDAGLEPVKIGSWARLRHEYRNRPEAAERWSKLESRPGSRGRKG